MFVSVPIRTSKPLVAALSARISSMRARSVASSTWSPKPCEAEWSVIARYFSPRSFAAATISSAVARAVGRRRVAMQVAA